jgi:hypothetical protein
MHPAITRKAGKAGEILGGVEAATPFVEQSAVIDG